MLAALGIADDGDVSNYRMSVEKIPSEGEMAAQKNMWLNCNYKSAARKKVATDKQARLNHD